MSLGADVRYLALKTSVRGVFEEGPGVGQWQSTSFTNGSQPSGPGSGTDMEELKVSEEGRATVRHLSHLH